MKISRAASVLTLGASAHDLQILDLDRFRDTQLWRELADGFRLGGLAQVTVVLFHHAGIPVSELLGHEDQWHSRVHEPRGICMAKFVDAVPLIFAVLHTASIIRQISDLLQVPMGSFCFRSY